MPSLDTPLNDAELDRLDSLLLDRVPEEEADASAGAVDEGILDISELDGFLTAIISGPEAIQPSQWLPVLWGAFEPQWASPAEAEEVLALILRHMNAIVATLMEVPEDFEPIVLEREVEGKTLTSVDEWCVGYMKGVALAAQAWREGGEQVTETLFPITVFSSPSGWERLKELSDEEVAVLQRTIPKAVRTLHAFWRQRRDEGHEPFRHDTPPAGRNDPCPCGSGKKFKKCCLH